jgi:hypothetical protein
VCDEVNSLSHPEGNMRPTTQAARFVVSICLVWIAFHGVAAAQQVPRRDQLPGTTTGELLTGAGIIVASGVLSVLLFPAPRPEFHVRPADFRDGTAERILAEYQGPVALRSKGLFGQTRGGAIRSVDGQTIALEGSSKSYRIQTGTMKEATDLPSAAARARAGRYRAAMILGGLAGANLYLASIEESPFEQESRRWNRIMAGSSAALGVISVLLKSGIEREHAAIARRGAVPASPLVQVQPAFELGMERNARIGFRASLAR